jgi:hypothetical protein
MVAKNGGENFKKCWLKRKCMLFMKKLLQNACLMPVLCQKIVQIPAFLSFRTAGNEGPLKSIHLKALPFKFILLEISF